MNESEKKENITKTGWDDPRNYIKRDTDTSGMVTYRGSFVLNGFEFRFSMRQQITGKYLMRGRVSAISPEDGFVLQVVGGEKRRRLNRQMDPSLTKELTHKKVMLIPRCKSKEPIVV